LGTDVAGSEFQAVSPPPSPPLPDLVWQSIHIADPPVVEGGADLPYGAIYLGTKEGPAGAAPLIGTLLTYPVEFFSVLDLGSGAFLTPGSGIGKKSGSGIRIRDEKVGSYLRELS
jgi:hypothetical protein